MAAASGSSLASTKEEAGATAFTKEIDSEWEIAGAKSRQSVAGVSSQPLALTSLKSRFNRVLLPNRRYAGMSRRICLIASLTTFLLLLALIIGLAVGLTQRKQWDSPVAAATPSKVLRITPNLKPDLPSLATPVLSSLATEPSVATETSLASGEPEETIEPEPEKDPGPSEPAVEAPIEEEDSTDTDSNSGGTQNLPLPSNSQTFSGELTYYDASLGACGGISTNADYIAAVSWETFDAAGSSSATGGNSNNNPLCGRKLRITRTDARDGQQKSADLTVVDRCTGCKPTDIDTTIGVFTQLAAEELGRVDVTWAWLPN